MPWNALQDMDRQVIEWANPDEALPWMDALMRMISGYWLWISLVLVFFVVRRLSAKRWDFGFFLASGLGIGLTDLISSFLLKPNFARLRPCKEPELVIRIIDGCAGSMGFPSNHAANSMVICSLLFFTLPRPYAWLAFLIPLVIGYSRIYLGVHYPTDVLAGFLVGFAVAVILQKTLVKRFRNLRSLNV